MSRISRAGALLALVLLTALSIGGPAGADQQRLDEGKQGGESIPAAWAKHNKAKGGANGDPDRDGLTNWGEWRSHTKPRKADSDRDGVRDAREDFDGDGVRNRAEVARGTDPRVKDAGGDGAGKCGGSGDTDDDAGDDQAGEEDELDDADEDYEDYEDEDDPADGEG